MLLEEREALEAEERLAEEANGPLLSDCWSRLFPSAG
jgi:hypothetical protein